MEQQFNRKHGAQSRSFELGQPVLARDYRGKRVAWTPGIIRRRRGTVLYEVQVGTHTSVRHANQIRSSGGTNSPFGESRPAAARATGQRQRSRDTPETQNVEAQEKSPNGANTSTIKPHEDRCDTTPSESSITCCVDEVAGQRFQIDALVHYGRACLSKITGRLPVLYVFGQRHLSTEIDSLFFTDAVQLLYNNCISKSGGTQTLLITYDFCFQNAAYVLYKQLESYCRQPALTSPAASASSSPLQDTLPPKFFARCGRTFHLMTFDVSMPKPPWSLVHLGGTITAESEGFMPLYRVLVSLPEVTHSGSFYLNVDSGELTSSETTVRTLLKRRSYLIEKSKDAQRFIFEHALQIGTLSVCEYQHIIERIKRLLRRAGRFYITLAVGRLNPAKLANLPELDLLVLIACPEASLFDSREMLIPVVTPFELECALSSVSACVDSFDSNETSQRLWTGEKFWVDFRDLLPGGPAYCPEEMIVPDCLPGLDAPGDVSLVTGRVRMCKLSTDGASNEDHSDNGTMMVRGEWAVADTDVSQATFTRTWYGLDPRLGQTPVAQLREGLHGVPTHYTTEMDVTSGNNP
ncbi:diphthamide biosynthesis protein 2 [Paragonimus westermani]|uniref:Diphthamide biosynthesis protein 2 n=1 Tax=Paragonimus westermani TaxID=34504 RepID=A0A5J4NPM2_9TREM|nr:diphthamide biosynthesis protein 2 [Paragonimus westermani]